MPTLQPSMGIATSPRCLCHRRRSENNRLVRVNLVLRSILDFVVITTGLNCGCVVPHLEYVTNSMVWLPCNVHFSTSQHLESGEAVSLINMPHCSASRDRDGRRGVVETQSRRIFSPRVTLAERRDKTSARTFQEWRRNCVQSISQVCPNSLETILSSSSYSHPFVQ